MKKRVKSKNIEKEYRENKSLDKELEELKEKSKKISIKEASAWSFMDGFGLRYITPYAVEIGKNSGYLNTFIGLITSIPSLLGSLSQILTIKAMNKFSRKKIVFWGVILQALMWIPLIIVGTLYYYCGLNSELTLSYLVIIYTFLIIFGAIAGPAWSSIMKDTVTKDRGEYFGKRSKIAGFVGLVCVLIASFILDYFKKTNVFFGFIILFTIAFFGRMTSAFLFLRQYEPNFKFDKKDYFTLQEFVKKMAYNNFGRFVLFFALMSLAVTIASPFFVVYMLKELNFSYVQYMIVIISSSTASFLSMRWWGRLADKYGNLIIIKICGYLIPFVPILWLVPNYLPDKAIIVSYLVFIEIISGFIWGGFNLSAGNFIYDAVTPQKMAVCVSYFNVINGIGTFIGPLIGGFFASSISPVFGLSALLVVFVISGVVRFIVSAYMIPKIKEVREVKKFKFEISKIKKINKIFKENMNGYIRNI